MSIYKARRDDLENQLNKGALWAVVYGDLMSYLMIFFLVMFSFSVTRDDKTKSRKYEESLSSIQKVFGGKANEKQIEKAKARENEDIMISKLEESAKSEGLQNLMQLQLNEKRVRIILSEGILFDSGDAKLKEKAQEILLPIINELKKAKNEIMVEGHTDTVPIKKGRYSNNWELSMARAYSVIRFMEEAGIPSNRLAGIGYGENRPIGDNATLEGRAKNRRIEISMLKVE